jgi:hypothetical protein
MRDYSWPMHGWWHAISRGTSHPRDAFAAVCLLVQLVYLAIHWRTDSFFWRIGITFGIAGLFLSPAPWSERTSFTRDLIALTIAFNLLLMKERRLFVPWFLAGNSGLSSTFVHMVGAFRFW